MADSTKPFTSLNKRIDELKRYLSDQINDNPKKFYSKVVIALIMIIFLLSAVFMARQPIRKQQMEALIFQNITTKNLVPITDLSVIEKEPAVTAVFASPAAKNYQEMMALITRKEKELNRSIYFVPVVYDKEAFKETYKITSEEITFIFFEKGKEKNRFTYEELTTPTNELMPELNRLPMWNIKVLESDEKTS